MELTADGGTTLVLPHVDRWPRPVGKEWVVLALQDGRLVLAIGYRPMHDGNPQTSDAWSVLLILGREAVPMGRSRVADGAPQLLVVGGSPLLRPEEQVFEAMLAGWRDQRMSRNLARATIEDRLVLVRRFHRLDELLGPSSRSGCTRRRLKHNVRVLTPAVEGTTLAEVLRVLDALEAADIGTWLEGGWGVDALVGRQTRWHRDVDVDIDAAQEAVAIDVLRSLGYEIWADHRPNRIEMIAHESGWVDLHPLLFYPDGSAQQPGVNGEFYDFPSRYFTTGTLAGRRIGCFTIEAQQYFRTGYEQRPIDVHDLAQLDQLAAHAPSVNG